MKISSQFASTTVVSLCRLYINYGDRPVSSHVRKMRTIWHIFDISNYLDLYKKSKRTILTHSKQEKRFIYIYKKPHYSLLSYNIQISTFLFFSLRWQRQRQMNPPPWSSSESTFSETSPPRIPLSTTSVSLPLNPLNLSLEVPRRNLSPTLPFRAQTGITQNSKPPVSKQNSC